MSAEAGITLVKETGVDELVSCVNEKIFHFELQLNF